MYGRIALCIMSRIPNLRAENASLSTQIQMLTTVLISLDKTVRSLKRKRPIRLADADVGTADDEDGDGHTNTRVIVASDGDGADGDLTRTPTLASDGGHDNMEGNGDTMATAIIPTGVPGTLAPPSTFDGLIVPAPRTVQILMMNPQFERPKVTLSGRESFQALSLTIKPHSPIPL